MNDEREIKFIYSEKVDEKVFNRILELMKVGKLKIEQENIFDDILITYVPGVKDVEVVPSSGV